MSKKSRALATLIVAVVLAALAWLLWRPQDPLFHGQRESAWIASLNTILGNDELARWHAFGPEAAPLLARALRKGSGPMEKKYFQLWPKLPGALRRRLPAPVDYSRARANAARLLADLGPGAKNAARALARAMTDTDADVRVNSARCLENVVPALGEGRNKLAGDFVIAAGDSNYIVRADAMLFLAGCQDATTDAAPLLIKGLDDPERTVRAAAMMALNAMNTDAAVRAGLVPVLVKQLQNKDVTVRVFAARKLGAMRREPKIVVPVLTELLGDNATVARFAAATALGKFGGDARSAVPTLVKLLDAPEPPVRKAAFDALQQIDPAAIAGVPSAR